MQSVECIPRRILFVGSPVVQSSLSMTPFWKSIEIHTGDSRESWLGCSDRKRESIQATSYVY